MRASQRRDLGADGLVQEREELTDGLEEGCGGIDKAGLCGLEHEAGEVVALEEAGAVEDAAGEVTGVDADEGVGGAGVTAEADDAGVHAVVDGGVDVGVDGVHGLAGWAPIPVEGDALHAGGVDEAAWFAGDGEEGLEDVAVEYASLVLFRAVGHEVDHEVVGVGGDQTAEWCAEVVWVVEDGELRGVVGLSCGLVVGESIVAEQAVEMFPAVHLEDTNVATVHECVTLLWSAAFNVGVGTAGLLEQWRHLLRNGCECR